MHQRVHSRYAGPGMSSPAHEHAGKVADDPHHRRAEAAHHQTHAILLRRGHAAPVAAERRHVQLPRHDVVVVGEARRKATHAVADPVDRPSRHLALRPGEHARDVQDARVAHAHLGAHERALPRTADAAIVEGEYGVAQPGEVGRELRVVAPLHAHGAADHNQGRVG